MIDDFALGYLKGVAEKTIPGAPRGLGTWRWFLVPAWRLEGGKVVPLNDVEMDVATESDVTDVDGVPVLSREKVHVTILLREKVPVRGLPYVSGLRLGWDAAKKIVVWSVL